MLTIGFIDTLVRAYDLEPSYSFVASSTDRLCLDSQTDQQMRFFSSNIYLIPKLVCNVKLIREGLKYRYLYLEYFSIFLCSIVRCGQTKLLAQAFRYFISIFLNQNTRQNITCNIYPNISSLFQLHLHSAQVLSQCLRQAVR